MIVSETRRRFVSIYSYFYSKNSKKSSKGFKQILRIFFTKRGSETTGLQKKSHQPFPSFHQLTLHIKVIMLSVFILRRLRYDRNVRNRAQRVQRFSTKTVRGERSEVRVVNNFTCVVRFTEERDVRLFYSAPVVLHFDLQETVVVKFYFNAVRTRIQRVLHQFLYHLNDGRLSETSLTT